MLLILCCAGLGVLLYVGYQSLKMETDPAAVAQTAKELTDIAIPADLKPKTSVRVVLPFANKPAMNFAVYEDQDSHLILAGLGNLFAGLNQQQVSDALDQSLRQAGAHEGKPDQQLVDINVTHKKLTIRNQPADFTIQRGKDSATKKDRVHVTGMFQGKSGQVMLIFSGSGEKWPEQQVNALLESIR